MCSIYYILYYDISCKKIAIDRCMKIEGVFTIIEIKNNEIHILREEIITKDDIENVLKEEK